MRHLLLTLACIAIAAPATAQSAAGVPPPATVEKLSGPRVGVTVLSAGVRRQLETIGQPVGTLITQFGWQYEKQFHTTDGGITALHEWVVLVGGAEQHLFIPSISWLVGLRAHNGVEFGVGPNVSPAGVALALAAGVTMKAGALNVPLNIAVVPTSTGTRLTMLAGFTLPGR